MSGQEIVVKINKHTAEVNVEAFGYHGNGCSADIEKILKAVGGKTTSRQSKPEMAVLVRTQQVKR